MDHAEVRERLVDAVAESGRGIRRDAGDDPQVREHLAGCAACRAEAASWTRTTDALRASGPIAASRELAPDAVLPADLRARTIALVRAAGVPRNGAAVTGLNQSAVPGEAIAAAPVPIAASRAAVRRSWRPLALLATAAAIVLLAGGATGLQLLGQRDRAQDEVADLSHLTATMDQVLRDPSRQVVTLARATDGAAAGTVAWSAASSELVVISDALAPAPDGQLYRCWVERNGVRTSVGRMRFSGPLAYWAGPMDGWGGSLARGDRFGVSLAPAAGGAGGDPILMGTF